MKASVYVPVIVSLLGVAINLIWSIINYRFSRKIRKEDWLEKIKPKLRVEDYQTLSTSAMKVNFVNDGGDCYNCSYEKLSNLNIKIVISDNLPANSKFSGYIATFADFWSDETYKIVFKYSDIKQRCFEQVLKIQYNRVYSIYNVNFEIPVEIK